MKGVPVESTLRAAREKGRKLLVPYITGGLREDWVVILLAMAEAGADAIEVGLPFSDPMMDGPTIQEASSPRSSAAPPRTRSWATCGPLTLLSR